MEMENFMGGGSLEETGGEQAEPVVSERDESVGVDQGETKEVEQVEPAGSDRKYGSMTIAATQTGSAVGEKLESYGVSQSAQKYIPEKILAHALTRYDELRVREPEKTVAALEKKGDLPAEVKRDVREMHWLGVRPENLTPQEMVGIRVFMNEETPEATEKKVEMTSGMLTKAINGVHHRRDYESFSPDDAERLEELRNIADDYDKGLIDPGKLRLDNVQDLLGEHEMREIADMTPDELAESDYAEILYDCMPVLGPWTASELIDISTYVSLAYGHIDNGVDRAEVMNFVPGIVRKRDDGIDVLETSFLRAYIQQEILPERRLNAQDLTVVFTATCRDILESGFLDKAKKFAPELAEAKAGGGLFMDDDEVEDEEFLDEMEEDMEISEAPDEDELKGPSPAEKFKKHLRTLRRSMGEGARYSCLLSYMRPSLVKKEYGTTKPVNLKLYEELQAEAESWTEARVKIVGRDMGSYCTKLDEHLAKIRVSYDELKKAMDGGEGGSEEKAVLLGDMFEEE